MLEEINISHLQLYVQLPIVVHYQPFSLNFSKYFSTEITWLKCKKKCKIESKFALWRVSVRKMLTSVFFNTSTSFESLSMTFVCFLASAQTLIHSCIAYCVDVYVWNDTTTLFIFVSFCWTEIRHSHQRTSKWKATRNKQLAYVKAWKLERERSLSIEWVSACKQNMYCQHNVYTVKTKSRNHAHCQCIVCVSYICTKYFFIGCYLHFKIAEAIHTCRLFIVSV